MEDKQFRLQLVSGWLDKAEDALKEYKAQLKQYKRSKDKEMIDFAQGQINYWQETFDKYSKEYNDLMSPDYDEFQVALERAKNVESVLRETNLSFPGLNHVTGQWQNAVGFRLMEYKEGKRDLKELISTLEHAEKWYEKLAYQGLVNGKNFRGK